MRRHAYAVCLVLLAPVAASIAAACGTFSGNDGPSSDAGATDGAAPDQTSPAADSGHVATDAGALEDAGPNVGGPPVVMSFSKAFISTSNMDGGLAIARPATAEKGDLLVLVTTTSGNLAPPSTPPIGPTDQVAFCPSTFNHLAYGVVVDDETPSYTFSWGTNVVSQLDAILIDVKNAGSHLDDFQILDDENTSNGAALPVTSFHAHDLVLVGFAVVGGSYTPTTFAAPDGGLSVLTQTNTMALYQGTYPAGPSPAFGPFSSATPCWGAFSLAIAPK